MRRSNLCFSGVFCAAAVLLTGCGGGGRAPVPVDSGNLAAPTAPADAAATSPRNHELNRTRRLQYKEAVAKLGGGSFSSHACMVRSGQGGVVAGSVSISPPVVQASEGTSFEFINAITNELGLVRKRKGKDLSSEGFKVSVERGLEASILRATYTNLTPTNVAGLSDNQSNQIMSCANEESPEYAGNGATGAYQEAFVKFKNAWPSTLSCAKAVVGPTITPTYQSNLQLTFEMGNGSIRLGDIVEVISTAEEGLDIDDLSAIKTQPTYKYSLAQDWAWFVGMDDDGYLQSVKVTRDLGGITTLYDCRV